jgi:hypothetical protein
VLVLRRTGDREAAAAGQAPAASLRIR